jgi:hypothetical protein
MSSEIIQIPSVLLTERAFESAQDEGILNIQPNRDHMLAIGQITDTGDVYVPDITILRQHNLINWDALYSSAPADYRYFPATELNVQERGKVYVSAGGLRQHMLNSDSRKIMELTVKDWGALGEAFASVIEDSKMIGQSQEGNHPKAYLDHAVSALGWLTSNLFNAPELASPQTQRIKNAAGLHPYIITRRT